MGSMGYPYFREPPYGRSWLRQLPPKIWHLQLCRTWRFDGDNLGVEIAITSDCDKFN